MSAFGPKADIEVSDILTDRIALLGGLARPPPRSLCWPKTTHETLL
jgi:hypothetical protein